ncbi:MULTISPECIES: hypothetical protein [Paenibacillus]|uniref:hypothetical protein n=1 Tax=Paenibacillus illinoisensis TaxID=59845 RepID=UPI001C8D3EC0|nr:MULTISPECIES: hypothetical protein [Paenibacillus]MBY0216250.1 hypothetical protein [Paenibacillus illinoisensis]WJH30679.1 hypothetical protein N6H13_08650 [Paenibacillus sp. CC-CFT742]
MSEHAKYEEKITIIKGSTDSLHIRIPYNPAYIQRIRQITGRQWESKLKAWIIPYTIAAVLQQWKASRGNYKSWSKELLDKTLKLRGYSRKTIKAYCN